MRSHVYIHVELVLEPTSNRWIAETYNPLLNGVLTYGATREEAYSKLAALALRVIAEQVEHGERPTKYLSIKFYDDTAMRDEGWVKRSSRSKRKR